MKSLTGPRERHDETETVERDVESCVSQICEEARMVLPGVQALFGFQLIAVFNQTFHDLSVPLKELHIFAIALIVVCICLLMTPAAYDRQTGTYKITRHFAKMSSTLLTVALLPLAVALSCEVGLVTKMAIDRDHLAFIMGGGTLVLLLGAWYIFPRIAHHLGIK
ncbi:MAG: DUF6328 family protein [Candidatus Obscuribacterales bacterium]|jgi:hypothetical protein